MFCSSRRSTRLPPPGVPSPHENHTRLNFRAQAPLVVSPYGSPQWEELRIFLGASPGDGVLFS